jgi:hypothetical protein
MEQLLKAIFFCAVRAEAIYRGPATRACTGRGLVYSAQGRIFSDLLYSYMRYLHLTKAKPIHKRQPVLSSERKLHKDYDRKGSVEKVSGRESQGACRQDELIGGKPSVVK